MSRTKWSDDKIIARLISNKTQRTYWDNIRELRKRASTELFGKCLALTKSQNAKERKIGIHVLAQLSNENNIRPFSKKTIELFINLLKKEEVPVNIMSILYGIGHNNEIVTKYEDVELITSFKNHNKDCVREGVTFALGGIINPKAISALIELSEDKCSYIRNWATFGIGNLLDFDNTDIRQCLWKRVNDKHQETKLEAINGLAKRSDKSIKPIIEKELHDGEFGTLLFEAIIELKDKTLLPTLEKQLLISECDESIQTDWINDLKDCIEKLKHSC